MPPSQVDELLNALPLAALLIDADERVAAFNAAAEALIEIPLANAHYVSVLRQPDLVDAISACLADGSAHRIRYVSNKAEGDSVYEAHCALSRFETVQGLPDQPAVLVSFVDVSHVEQASQQRRDFVANVSHELRTPLTSLMGFIETLRGPAKDDRGAQSRFLEIMANEAARMERLVHDLLSLSRVESTQRRRPRDQVNMGALVRETIGALAPAADQAGVNLICDVPSEELEVIGDADQLRQVASNLVENAIKYGGTGKDVSVSLTYIARDASLRAPAVVLSVRDQGPGIDPLHIPRLTERFYRVDTHRSREVGGTGLGLAIVKHIVTRHRGRMRIESQPEHGSTFIVVLPLDGG